MVDKLSLLGSSLLGAENMGQKKEKIQKDKLKRTQFKDNLRQKEMLAQQTLHSGQVGLRENETVEDLLDNIYSLGEELKKNTTLQTLKRYKQSVQRFYSHVVNQSLESEKIRGRLNPATMSRKEYTLVSIVDEKLEKLGAAVLRNQRDQLELLRKIDEIYGILVDFTR